MSDPLLSPDSPEIAPDAVRADDAETTVARAGLPAVEPSALRSVGAHLRFWIVVVLGLTIDLWSKEWAFQTLRQGGRRVLIPDVLEFQTTLNPGALFGIGAGHTEIFLIASVLALVLVLWMFAQSSPRQRIMQIALGALLAGALGNMYDRVFVKLVRSSSRTASGVVVPLYFQQVPSSSPDMIRLSEYPPGDDAEIRTLPRGDEARLGPIVGYVRDFIKIPTRWFGQREIWPWVFNVADMLLVGGVAILAIRLFFERGPRPATKTDLDATPPSS